MRTVIDLTEEASPSEPFALPSPASVGEVPTGYVVSDRGVMPGVCIAFRELEIVMTLPQFLAFTDALDAWRFRGCGCGKTGCGEIDLNHDHGLDHEHEVLRGLVRAIADDKLRRGGAAGRCRGGSRTLAGMARRDQGLAHCRRTPSRGRGADPGVRRGPRGGGQEEEGAVTPPTREKRPAGREWIESTYPSVGDPNVMAASAWHSGPVSVLSSLIVADMPDGNGTGLQWLISITDEGKRPKPHHVRRALRAFGMTDAELDNHHPGNALHYFLVCDPDRRVSCECKTDEVTVRDADGYAWTTPAEGHGECRGCEFERITGKPCPVHRAAAGGTR